LEYSNSLPAYLRWLFLRIVTAPPPYTMESINTLQVVMGVTDLSSPRILKKTKTRKHEQKNFSSRSRNKNRMGNQIRKSNYQWHD
jgi:hypothetical protein